LTDAHWFLLVGCLMVAMGLNLSVIRRLPVTSAIIYLAVGVAVGPMVLGLFHFNPLKESGMLETLTEMAVLVSLFAAGLKMPVPFGWLRWRTPILLASVSMALTVALVAGFARYVLDLPWGLGVLLGAIVSPTDPVLATEVQTRQPGDHDRLRFSLTCEAGMNDGSAFPFVMLGMWLLGMREIGHGMTHWLLVDVVWATAAGIGVGLLSGFSLARLCFVLRRRGVTSGLLNDLLGLGLIGAVYGISGLISAWGFLAVFFAGVALRQTESKLVGKQASDFFELATDSRRVTPDAPEMATVSVGSLLFKEHLERLSEILLVLLVGGTQFLDSWSWRGVGFACFLFFVARPLCVLTGLAGSATPWRIRGLAAWLGVRGIGSLYYLMYAIDHGLPEPMAVELLHLTLIVVTLSILVHGVSAKPLLGRFPERQS
jgi:NhaP-type Na+/H+ or K+/H+ antiporter